MWRIFTFLIKNNDLCTFKSTMLRDYSIVYILMIIGLFFFDLLRIFLEFLFDILEIYKLILTSEK